MQSQPTASVHQRHLHGADDDPEVAQSSKYRRTASEIQGIAMRRLLKSQSLHEAPQTPVDSRHHMPAKRSQAGLFIVSSTHSKSIFENNVRSNVSVTSATFAVQGNSPSSGEPDQPLSTAKKTRHVAGTTEACCSGAVACTPTYNEEKNPATLRHRPPRIELQGSSPQTPAGGCM